MRHTCFLATLGLVLAAAQPAFAQNGTNPPAVIDIRDPLIAPAPDNQSRRITDAAQAFLATLSDRQRAAVLFPLTDDAQRSNWSNLPDGIVTRRGIRRGDMTQGQLTALDTLLATVTSAEGMQNIRYQLAAEDSLSGARFSSDLYYVSFLGTPSDDAAWMLQFGGHHLALNVTVFGPDLTFSPMLTGGQPLHITYEGADVFVTAAETRAAKALLDSLSADQKSTAIRSNTRASLLLGPGTFGTVVAPEGLPGRDMTEEQQALLVALIETRLGFMNADDFAAKMQAVRAGLNDTYFGWWGPQGRLGEAYVRVTGPELVLEYAPQELGGDPTDHAHNMYRDPTNDYGIKWIEAE